MVAGRGIIDTVMKMEDFDINVRVSDQGTIDIYIDDDRVAYNVPESMKDEIVDEIRAALEGDPLAENDEEGEG